MIYARYILKATMAIVAFLTITGCSFFDSGFSFGKDKAKTSPANNAEIEQKLIEAAKSVEHSLAILAMTQEASNPPVLNTGPLVTPEGGMGGTADIDWTGPIEPLIYKIANLTDYTVKTFGTAPAIPIVVSITQNKSVIADILKNASLQAGKKANIMVFPASRIIELRYVHSS